MFHHLVIGARVIDLRHEAMVSLSVYCAENVLEVNTVKTKFMKFRQGGRLNETEKVSYAGQPIEHVNQFVYPGTSTRT